MDNFDDFERKSYRPAERRRYRAVDYFAYFYNIFMLGLKITFVMVKETVVGVFSAGKVKNISGQLALVTGAANGLGRAIASELASHGCDIVIIDINEAEAEKAAAEIRENYKVKVKAYKVDVSDFEAIQKLKKDIEIDSPGQSVDILVNNAGILSAISLREGEPQQIQKVIDVNLTSHFWTTRTFLGQMIRKKRGHIVGIASISSKVTMPRAIAYSTSKCGVDGFYRALFDELCSDDHDDYIITTCVFPAFINTRRELKQYLDDMKGVGPLMSPSYAAKKVVEAIRKNRRSLVLPFHARLMYIAEYLPPKAAKFAKSQWVPGRKKKS